MKSAGLKGACKMETSKRTKIISSLDSRWVAVFLSEALFMRCRPFIVVARYYGTSTSSHLQLPMLFICPYAVSSLCSPANFA